MGGSVNSIETLAVKYPRAMRLHAGSRLRVPYGTDHASSSPHHYATDGLDPNRRWPARKAMFGAE